MIESGHISEINEREKSPFAAVVARYHRQANKQATRAANRNRPLLPREKKVIEFAHNAIARITLLEA